MKGRWEDAPFWIAFLRNLVRLMLACLLVGIIHDRRLLREVRCNIPIGWVFGHRLHETLPDGPALTRIRHRGGPE